MSELSVPSRTAAVLGVICCLLATGCTRVEPALALPQEPSPAVSPVVPAVSETQPAVATPAPPPSVVDIPPAAAPPAPPISASAAPAVAPQAPIASQSRVARPVAPVKPVQPPPVTAPPAVMPRTAVPSVPKTSTTPAATRPAVPTLDLDSLERRLRETKGIGTFTKLSLKNQVDDLLDKFRAYYKRQSKLTPADLRRPYDMLLLKVLSLLQDSDPPLARDIVASREAIWGILSDQTKFNEANLMAGVTP